MREPKQTHRLKHNLQANELNVLPSIEKTLASKVPQTVTTHLTARS